MVTNVLSVLTFVYFPSHIGTPMAAHTLTDYTTVLVCMADLAEHPTLLVQYQDYL